MGSRALLVLAPAILSERILLNHIPSSGFHQCVRHFEKKFKVGARHFSVHSSLERPDVARLAETARISLTSQEFIMKTRDIRAEDFAPKIQQVVDWFGQLQEVDLQSIEPAIRADTEAGSLREDTPETFDNREAIIAAIPSYEESYIKLKF